MVAVRIDLEIVRDERERIRANGSV